MEKESGMTDLSIVIVNWNTRQLVLDCIRSIYETAKECRMQVIVVDNASEDGSVQAVRQQFPQVEVIENRENLGFARGNNQGMAVAEGRYLCLINSDVVVLEGCLNHLMNYLDAHPQVGMVGPKLLWKDRTLQWSCRKFPSLWNTFCPAVGLPRLFPRVPFFSGEHMGYFPHDRVCQVDVLVGAFLMVRREAYEQVGGMDENYFMYCEEVDWCRRFHDAGWKIVFLPEAQAVHYGGGSSDREPVRFFREYCLSLVKYWKKHHSPLEVCLFRLIFFLRQVWRWPLRFVLYAASSLLGKAEKKDYYRKKLQMIYTGMRCIFKTC